ncbi:glycosyltransferase [Fulvivirga sediminis]|uniref:Glycosyltransferase n=1 Tax=Fulvivirga sediminis TaxID=2803949 RepID=A0A937F9X1_9BACT|nr:glycosyltransferase [Fulvivirga sediminis]MBL3658385.1 glycosyltransferase [Fulvivirga sediminis]
MKKHKLVIGSILKPVDDTRMYEKFGLSLDQTTKYDINIIGFYSKKLPKESNIKFHPIFHFKRLHPSRLLAPSKFLKKLIELRPEIVIINSHELLLTTTLYKIFFGAKIIYDVRENYFRNLLFTPTFPLLLRPLLAGYVRAKEYLSTLFFDHYILAEKQYAEEFSFSKKKHTIIENKYLPQQHFKTPTKRPEKTLENSEKIRLIFSGTIAESTGVFEAISLAKNLHNLNPKIELKIVGFCSLPETLKRVKLELKNSPFITLIGGDQLVSHQTILSHIQEADFGIICYPKNRSTINSMPTKLYEYLGNQLPIILQNHERWEQLSQQYNAGIIINFREVNYHELISKMEQTENFYSTLPGEEILWYSEENKLTNLIEIESNNIL